MNNQLIRIGNSVINMAHVSKVRWDDGRLTLYDGSGEKMASTAGDEADALWHWLNLACLFGGEKSND